MMPMSAGWRTSGRGGTDGCNREAAGTKRGCGASHWVKTRGGRSMRRMRAVVAMSAALLAGCAPAADNNARGEGGTTEAPVASALASPAASPPAMSVSCTSSPSAYADPGNRDGYFPLPGDLTVVSAQLCQQSVVVRPGQGMWQQTARYEVVGGLDVLVEEYQRPDEPAGDGVCPAQSGTRPCSSRSARRADRWRRVSRGASAASHGRPHCRPTED